MKLAPCIRVTLLASALISSLSSARADLTIDDPNYTATSIYTSVDSNSILSFDYASSGTLYYASSTSSFTYGGFYSYNGSTTRTLQSGSSAYSGPSVVAIGNSVYFNNTDSSTFDNNIYKYSIPGDAISFVSNTTNYGLYKGSNGSLFLTGSPDFSTNHIYNTGLNSDGTFISNPAIDLGADSGSSGPLAFDSIGNLYYTAGSGDMTIYKWTAADVANALANPGTMPLTIAEAQAWATYTSGGVGGTSMLIYNNQLLLTLTNFGSPPTNLLSFGMNSDGTWSGTSDTILSDLTSGSSLGELRSNGGNLYLSDGNQIYQIQSVPEPSSIFLVLVGIAGLILFRKRQARRFAPMAALMTSLVFFSINSVHAGPFSPAADQPGSTGVSASSSSIVEWANGVVSFTPGPVDITNPTGATASFGNSSKALGASDSTLTNPNNVVSLGDGGSITLSFAQPITNGIGADFAVFENGFPQTGVPNSYFLELATVSVSSDGVHFFTFPSVSLTPTGTQVASFGTLDPTNLYNLAGAEIVGYGTPFNLDDLSSITSPYLNINSITQIRVTDVIGNVNTTLGAGTYTYDDASNPIFNGAYGAINHVINDPFKTNFAAGGFDLDAVGILNAVPEPSTICYLAMGFLIVLATPRFLRKA